MGQTKSSSARSPACFTSRDNDVIQAAKELFARVRPRISFSGRWHAPREPLTRQIAAAGLTDHFQFAGLIRRRTGFRN